MSGVARSLKAHEVVAHGGKSGIAEFEGHGVKYVDTTSGYRYYSVQDTLDAVGVDFHMIPLDEMLAKVGGYHMLPTSSEVFFYTDLAGMEYVFRKVGTAQALRMLASIQL